jgi:hypothetical protein
MLPLNANSLSERKGDLRSRKIARFGLVISLSLVMTIAFQKDSSVASNYKPTHYKQYILMTLNDLDQTYCAIDLFTKESRFNPKAKNGSHYGIPQGRSKYLSRVNGFKQIDWSYRYVSKRYGVTDKGVPDMCAAWKHWQDKGWH